MGVGELSRESFATQKKSMTAQMEEIACMITELERKANTDTDSSNAVIEKFKSYVGITELTKEIASDLLNRVTIFPGGVMEVKLNLTDEIEKLLNEIRRESFTA